MSKPNVSALQSGRLQAQEKLNSIGGLDAVYYEGERRDVRGQNAQRSRQNAHKWSF